MHQHQDTPIHKRTDRNRIYKRHGVWWFIVADKTQADVKPHPSFVAAVNDFQNTKEAA